MPSELQMGYTKKEQTHNNKEKNKMRCMTFSEILDLENGQQVPSFQGTIKKVWDQKTGEGEYGQWWLQNIILQDEHANEITVTWTLEDACLSEDQGRTILFESGRNKKEQLVGLKKEIRNKNGKRYESVKIDDRAKVKILSGGSDAGEVSNDECGVKKSGIGTDQRTNPPPAQTLPPYDPDWPDAPPPSDQTQVYKGNDLLSGVDETRKHIMQSANLLVLCHRAVNAAVAPHVPAIAQNQEQYQSDVAKIFIEASSRRTNDGVHWWSYVDKMDTKPLESEKPY